MKLRMLIQIIFIVIIFKHANAQKTSDNSADINSNPRKFNLSVFIGFSMGGPKKDMEKNMSLSGLGDPALGFWTIDYPSTNKMPVADIEATYYLTKNKGISLNIGGVNSIRVMGHQSNGSGNATQMFLDSKIFSISLNYSYRSMNKKHNFFIGPSYIVHRVTNDIYNAQSTTIKNKKLGAYIGHSFQFLQKKHWFIALKTNFRWAPKSKIGPFTVQSGSSVSVFLPTQVNLACLNIGLCIGIR